MRMFFPNGTIDYPPSLGPHIHKYQITQHLTTMGYEITTFAGDKNPEVNHIPKEPLSVLRTLRQSDVVYLRTGEGVNNATRLTSPGIRRLIRKETVVIWEMNLDVALKVRRIPRTNKQVDRDIRILRRQAERVDAAICVTESIAEQANRLLGIGRAIAVSNGSDPEMFRPDLPKMTFPDVRTMSQVLDIAWIASEANAIHDARLVVELARLIDQRELPFRIHAIGDTAGLFPSPVPSSVVIHGPISYIDLPRYLASMDVGLVLYNIRYDGGSPLKLFDYLASGCIPICSHGRGIEDVLQGTGVGLVEAWTAESLCDALSLLQRDSKRLEAMAAKGRELITGRYNWKAIAVQTDQIIRDCINERSSKCD